MGYHSEVAIILKAEIVEQLHDFVGGKEFKDQEDMRVFGGGVGSIQTLKMAMWCTIGIL